MSNLSRIVLAACAWAAIATPPAIAADMAPAAVPMPPREVGAWYLRGDIGYKIWMEPDVDWDDSLAGVDFDDEEIDDTWMVGVGVGRKFNSWLRADVTVDYEFPADFEATTPCPAPCGGATTNSETGELSAWTALANLYLDLGNFSGFVPYVGAGAGMAYVKMDDIVTESAGIFTDIGDASDWNFAWALMAGFAYEFSPNLALDAGYRYIDLGEVDSDTLTGFGAGDGDFTYDDLRAHEIRVGLRYTIL